MPWQVASSAGSHVTTVEWLFYILLIFSSLQFLSGPNSFLFGVEMVPPDAYACGPGWACVSPDTLWRHVTLEWLKLRWVPSTDVLYSLGGHGMYAVSCGVSLHACPWDPWSWSTFCSIIPSFLLNLFMEQILERGVMWRHNSITY